ncbi:MAG TPA: sigma factor-like helix-turn-helix DNA-binding protein [Kofleriaceae bacterium]|nr:sigma factor-like helix-turn-helix DNA-binding protein [Kofleriaceae bacterium]
MQDSAANERAIDEAWDAGRAAWPQVALTREQLASFMAEHDRIGTRYPADVYLAAACLAGNHDALVAFDRDVLQSARGAIRSIDASDTFIDEACQRLRASLLVGDGERPRIADYAGRGPLRAWVGVAAVRTALMMRRSQQRSREVPEDDWSGALVTISTGNPELELLKRQYATAFTDALREAVRMLEPRLRTVLRMSFVEALSIDEIGAVYAVHRATAARWIQRACDAVFEQTRNHLASKLRLTPTELDRVTALVQSQLDVSLSQLLPSNID